MGATRRLAKAIVGARVEDGAVTAEARRTFLNYVGCAIGGSAHGMIDRLVAGLAPAMGAGAASLLGRRERCDAFHAALVNGASSNVHGFDDTHLETVIHPGGPPAAAMLALSDVRSASGSPVSGRDFLEAMVVGVEASCRIGLASGPGPYQAGWHVTGTCGVFAAAAAAGRLLGLDAGQMTHALGMAASQPVGMRQAFGSMTVSLHVGLAAQAGLTAAMLAAQGFTASPEGLEGRTGWARLIAPAFDFERLGRPFGPAWEISANTYKPYACGIVTHPAMEAAMRLSQAHDLSAEAVARVRVEAHPLVEELTGLMQPRSAQQSKVSIGHAVAVAIAHRRGGPAQFAETAVFDPAIRALRGRIVLVTDPVLGRAEARVVIETTDGRRLEHHVVDATGSRMRPMSDHDLDDKVEGLCIEVLGAVATRRVIDLCRDVGELADVADVARAARGGG